MDYDVLYLFIQSLHCDSLNKSGPCEHEDREILAALSLVNHKWSDITMKFLRKQIHINGFCSLVIGDKYSNSRLTVPEEMFEFCRTLEVDKFPIIQQRLHHIRSIHGLQYNTAQSVLFDFLSATTRGDFVIPALRHISVELFSQHCFFPTLLLLQGRERQLTHMDIVMNDHFCIGYLRSFLKGSNSLQYLRLDASSVSEIESPLQACDAHQATLQKLVIHIDPVLLESLIHSLPVFHVLTKFHCHLLWPDIERHHLASRVLAKACRKFFDRTHELTDIVITTIPCDLNIPYITTRSTMDRFAFLQFFHLSVLHLGFGSHLDITADCLFTIGTHLPGLKVVDLINLAVPTIDIYYRPAIHLGDIAHFVYLCPQLHSLSICFNARQQRVDLGNGIMPLIPWKCPEEALTSHLRQLHVGGSWITREETNIVGEYIGKVFPNLEVLFCSGPDYFPLDGGDQVASWESVSVMLFGQEKTLLAFSGTLKYHNYVPE
ncbi:hypothetical protein CPB86DRAFT_869847 [Serendipita vermifera]|nr:hypothetical protein CPB86DRAFT_869847 [Serendipita vermifera]